MARPVLAEPGLGDALSTTWALIRFSVALQMPFGGSAVRPVGFFERGIKITPVPVACQLPVNRIYNDLLKINLTQNSQVAE